MKNDHLVTAIFIGRSGCGKGTQAGLFIEHLKKITPAVPVLYLETGARFRELVAGDSFTARRARAIMERGELQPSFLATWMWASELIGKMTGDEHLVIDGSPRKLGEAKSLASALSFYERPNLPKIFHLNVTRAWSEERLLARGRADDASLADIKRRLDWFDQEVAPAIEFLKNDERFVFADVDGERPIETIQADIISRL